MIKYLGEGTKTGGSTTKTTKVHGGQNLVVNPYSTINSIKGLKTFLSSWGRQDLGLIVSGNKSHQFQCSEIDSSQKGREVGTSKFLAILSLSSLILIPVLIHNKMQRNFC